MKTEIKAVLAVISMLAVATVGFILSDESDAAEPYEEYSYDRLGSDGEIYTLHVYSNGKVWVSGESMVWPDDESLTYMTQVTADFKGANSTYDRKDVGGIGLKLAGTSAKSITFIEAQIDDLGEADEYGRYLVLGAVAVEVHVGDYDVPYFLIPFVIGKYDIRSYMIANEYTFDGNKKLFGYELDSKKINKLNIPDEAKDIESIMNDIRITGQTSAVFANEYMVDVTLTNKDSYFYADALPFKWVIAKKNIEDTHDVFGGHSALLTQYYDISIEVVPLYYGQDITMSNVVLHYGYDYSEDSDYSDVNPIAASKKCNPVPSKGDYGGYTIEEKSGTRTAEQVTVIVTGIKNFTGSQEVIIPIVPVDISGYTLHIDTIHTDGTMNSGTFDDSNVFLFAIDQEFPTFSRENFQVVVLNARGGVVIDEPAGINYGKTASEWNYIEIHGINGFEGVVTGYFYEAFDGATAGVIFNTAGNKVIGYDGEFADVVIPATNNGLKVTKIADKAFKDNKIIESVVIGDNVAQVGMKAFANCTNLKSVVFGDSVKIIYSYAFFGCKNLEMLDFGLNLTNVKLKAFGSVTLQDVNGNEIEAVSKNLKGNTFVGSKGVLKVLA